MTTTTQTGDPRSILIFLVAIGCLAVLFVGIVFPVLARFTTLFEALTVLMQGLGSYFGNPRLVWLGCFCVVLGVIGCCIVSVVGSAALLTCSTSSPSQLCRLIGR